MQKAAEANGGNTDIDLKEMGRLISGRVYPPNTTPEMIAEYYRGNRGKTELNNGREKTSTHPWLTMT